ncbi:MAG: hypothetical protein WKF81_04360 [Thermomicrobiales bacterium]
MTEAERQAIEPETIPQPDIGAGSADLVTESHDTAELRDLLARARERLTFYESFDRIIGENVKRSGELMLETIQYREQADASIRESNKVKAEFAERLTAERTHHRQLLAGLALELDDLQSRLNSFRGTLQSTMSAFDLSASEAPTGSSGTESPPSPAIRASQPVDPTVPTAAPARSIDLTKTIDVLFHGIPDPGVALQLQRHLIAVDSVTNVEAREFAEGILRLQVTSNRPLIRHDFATWAGTSPIRILREQSNVIEATLAGV